MNIKEYLSDDFKALDINDSSERAIELFVELGYDYLPIVNNEELVACLSSDICFSDKLDGEISSYIEMSELFYVNKESNLLDALKVLGESDSNIVPVCDDDLKYCGYISQEDLMSFFSNTPLVEEIGGVIVLRKSIREFSVSEIAQVIESENAKVIGVFVSKFNEDDAYISVKINQIRLANIEAALKRFGYEVVESYHENRNIDNLEDRYKSLMNYLDI